MRTTIELSDESHEAVAALARRHARRGLSDIIQAAVDTYLASLDAQATEAVLALEGAIDEATAEAMTD